MYSKPHYFLVDFCSRWQS